jgi:hypothetical protein
MAHAGGVWGNGDGVGSKNITGLEHFVKQKMNFESLIAWYIDCTLVDSMLSA